MNDPADRDIEQAKESNGKTIEATVTPNPSFHRQSHIRLKRRDKEFDKLILKKLIICTVVACICLVGAVVASIFSNSLAITAEACNLLGDVSSYVIAILAVKLSQRPTSKRFTFGWQRAEVVSALISIMFIWMMAGILLYLAVVRMVKQKYKINALVMLITAAILLIFNIALIIVIHHNDDKLINAGIEKASEKINETPLAPILRTSRGDDDPDDEQDNKSKRKKEESRTSRTSRGSTGSAGSAKVQRQINLHIARVHIFADVVQCVCIFIAAFVIYFYPSYKVLDPFCALIFTIVVLFISLLVLKDLILVFMEATPSSMDYRDVVRLFYGIPNVKHVHSLRIWSLNHTRIALMVHLAVEPGTVYYDLLKEAKKLIHSQYEFFETTIQVEDYNEIMESCKQCVLPLKASISSTP